MTSLGCKARFQYFAARIFKPSAMLRGDELSTLTDVSKNRSVFISRFSQPIEKIYEGKSLNNRNFILKCMEKYAHRKILFRDTKWLLSNMSYRGRDDQAV